MVRDVLETLPSDLRSLELVSPELTASTLLDFLLAHDQLDRLNIQAPFTSARGHAAEADRDLIKTICRERRPPVHVLGELAS